MATIAEKITALETALANGERTVEYADFKVTYRSASELRSALEYFQAQQRLAAGKKAGMQVSYGSFSRE